MFSGADSEIGPRDQSPIVFKGGVYVLSTASQDDSLDKPRKSIKMFTNDHENERHARCGRK
jgi:hypothetical protein